MRLNSKLLVGLLFLATLLVVTTLSVVRLTPSLEAQQVTRTTILERSLNDAIIRFGLQVDPLRSEPYLTEVIETTYAKWSVWQHGRFVGSQGEEQRPILVMVYTGEFIHYSQAVEMRYKHAVIGYALDTGEYNSSALIPSHNGLDLSALR